MKFLSIILALLLCLSCGSASAGKDAVSTPMKSYTVSGFSFSVPDDFEETSITESEILFTAPSGAQMHVAILDGTGMDLEAAGQMFKYIIPVQNVQTQIAMVNDLPYMYCSFSDASMSVHGVAALFLDENAGDVYILFYISANELSIFEHVAWLKILDSIKAPLIYQQVLAQATPEPTPDPIPEIDFDFDTINRNPDLYKNKSFTIIGNVYQVIEVDEPNNDGKYQVDMLVSVDNDRDKKIYVVYYRESGDDRILEGDTITFRGQLDGIYTYESISGLKITVPLFFVRYLYQIS